ncbi:hypothetical protein JW921_05295 [Candidatus Fermentibacterales bacterium]|nr:hypothetical protein [Candidatus Fermentibacterales bacterium]
MPLILLLAAITGPVSFPMEAHGELSAYSFFEQDEFHFIYGELGTVMRVLAAGDFSWRLGMDMTTYMGKNKNHPEMKFNIYHAHWNLRVQFDYQLLEPLLVRLYTDHECYHNIDCPDSTSEYMNNIKIGAVYDPSLPAPSEAPALHLGGWPSGWLSFGIYRPKGESFQKGHDFEWSIQAGSDVLLAGWRSWLTGVRYEPSFYFHEDSGTSSRHELEWYLSYHPGTGGAFEAYIAWFPHDTQPFHALEGRSYWGIRFVW